MYNWEQHGLRISKIIGLRWRNIDLEKMQFNIQAGDFFTVGVVLGHSIFHHDILS